MIGLVILMAYRTMSMMTKAKMTLMMMMRMKMGNNGDDGAVDCDTNDTMWTVASAQVSNPTITAV